MNATSATSIAAPAPQKVELIPIGQLVPSEMNPRKTVDAAFLALDASKDLEAQDEDYLAVAEYAIHRADSNGTKRMAALLGWPKDTFGYGKKILAKKLKEVGIEAAVHIARLAVFSTQLTVSHTWGDSKCSELETVVKGYGVDVKAIRDQVKAEAAAKAKKKLSAKKATASPAKEPKSGTCRYCGCTQDDACEGGCEWVDPQLTVCSNEECIEKYEAVLRALPRVKGQKSKLSILRDVSRVKTLAAQKKRFAKKKPGKKAAKKGGRK